MAERQLGANQQDARADRVSRQVISHRGVVVVLDKHAHVVLNSNVIREDVHVPMVAVYRELRSYICVG